MQVNEIYENLEMKDGNLVYIGKETDGRKIQIPGTTTIAHMFENNKNLVYPPEIQEGVEDISWAFSGCTNLKYAPKLVNSIINSNGKSWKNSICHRNCKLDVSGMFFFKRGIRTS